MTIPAAGTQAAEPAGTQAQEPRKPESGPADNAEDGRPANEEPGEAEAAEPEADEPKADEPEADKPEPEEPEAEEPEPDEPEEPKADEPEADEPEPDEASTPDGEEAPKPADVAPDAAPTGTEKLTLYLRQSRVIDAPWPVKRVSVTDPQVAFVQLLTPTSVLLQGKAIGATDLILWRGNEEFRQTKVHVVLDLASLRADLTRMFPRSSFSLSQSRGAVVVSGTLGRAEHTAQLTEFM
ncbi:MAG: pilus assembly protein N-terminal domain-containing protein, partial [Planctomycetes bacterium]|nr:pilus assembly protein N-terminal domain-containing protein [Planctomycetota bacterium]